MWRVLLATLVALAGNGLQAAPPDELPFECQRTTEHGTFSGYQVTEENDSIIRLGGDERYTQGLRLTFQFHRNAVPCPAQELGHWLQGRLWPPAEAFETGLSLVLGQTLYTPQLITSRTLDPRDRGFSDFDYVGSELSLTADDRSSRHLFGLSVGALGHEGLARGAQGGLHTLKRSRIPKGWYSTEPKTVGANLSYRFERRAFCNDDTPRCWFDLTGGHAAELGNVRTALGLHLTGRLGWALTGFPAALIPTAADARKRPRWEIGAIFGAEGRAIAHTSLVQETPGSPGFSTERLVGDLRGGAYVRYESLRVTWQHVRRSPEFQVVGVPKLSQDFASVSVSYEPALVASPGGERPYLLRGWMLELGMGTNFAGPKLERGNPRGITAQLALRKDLGRGFNLGLVELSSATVEGDPIPGEPGDRSDVFLRQTSVTFGWGLLGKAGRVSARVGTALWAADARIQTLFHPVVDGRRTEQPIDRDYEVHRGGWLVGGQYIAPLERHLSVGVDVSYHALRMAETVPGVVRARYLQAILTAQVRP